MSQLKQRFSGIVVSIVVGLAALFLSQHYGAPAMLFAIILGIAMSFLYADTQCKAGIEFTANHVLRIGVALLGFRVAFDDLISMGWKTALLLVFAIVTTLLLGITLAKVLGLKKRLGVLTGGSVGICGASAAMAISAVLPDSKEKERDTLLTIIGVTALSTVTMIIYPIIASKLGLDATQTSLFLGATIHDVAQVVGAGYSVSEQTGDLAILTKLVRVAFLMPVVVCILLVIKLKFKQSKDAQAPGIPGFLIVFACLMTLNSVLDIPAQLTAFATEVSRFALVVSIAAIGMKSNLAKITEVGFKPIAILLLETAWIAVLVLLCLRFL